jgi:hypothetical protein
VSSVETESVGYSDSDSSSDTYSKGESMGESETEAVVPWYEQEEFKEVSGRAFRSPEELRERYRGTLIRQDPRCFQWKFHQSFPRPVKAPDVKPIEVSGFDRRNSSIFQKRRHPQAGR